MSQRLHITKTPKCYVGGAFIRSESGRVAELLDATGAFFANIPQCTRKDLRNAVEAAAKAGPGWAKRSAFNRGQILYRLAEMMEARGVELADSITLSGVSKAEASREVAAAIERVVHYAGWTDKYEQVLGSVNPVASAHFNFTVTEPMGIVGILAPDDAPVLGLLSLILPAITSGNSVVALASTTQPYPSILLGEMLATSDLPGGVVNLLTGVRSDLIPTFATHEHIRAISGVLSAEECKTVRLGAAESVKRVHLRKVGEPRSESRLQPETREKQSASPPEGGAPNREPLDWFADKMQGVEEIRALVEFKTTWHPVGA